MLDVEVMRAVAASTMNRVTEAVYYTGSTEQLPMSQQPEQTLEESKYGSIC